jgi:hypothetical protein
MQELDERNMANLHMHQRSFLPLADQPTAVPPVLCLQDQVFPEFVRSFLKDMFPAGDVPAWVRDAMAVAEIPLDGIATAPLPSAGTEQKAAPAAPAEDGGEGR